MTFKMPERPQRQVKGDGEVKFSVKQGHLVVDRFSASMQLHLFYIKVSLIFFCWIIHI